MNVSTTELLNRLTQVDDVKMFINEYEDEFLKLSCTEF